jgi:hypothetical protein
MENAYSKTPAEVLRHFQVSEERGLSEQQVRSLREKHGRNGRRPERRIGEDSVLTRAQRCPKTRLRPSGSSSSSSSRTSSSSSCSARPPYPLYSHYSRMARDGPRSWTRQWYVAFFTVCHMR